MADMVPQGTQLNGVPQGHESADANMRMVVISVVILMTTVLVTMMAMAGMFAYLNNRETAKDVGVPAAFAKRQLPPGPPLLPSPKEDKLPWAAYQDERREQEATAAKYGIINKETGAYQVPGPQLSAKQSGEETEAYFGSKSQWEQGASRYTNDSIGGVGEQATQQRFGVNGSVAPLPNRPGDEREIGPAQTSH